MANMVLTDNFRIFLSSILLSNTVANGVICSDGTAARRGWYGSGSAGDSVVAFEKITDTNNNKINCGICGAMGGSNGYYGQQASLNKFDPDNNLVQATEYKGDTFFRVGTGTTPAAESDYNLENEISADNLRIRLSSVHFAESGKGVLRYYLTFTNQSQNELTISEIGMFKWLNLFNYSTNLKSEYSVLFGRQVLTSPIVLLPGEMKMFALEIKI